jgi:SAM-dependent methyltransferase
VKPGPVLAVPCVEKGRGGGHLVRSLALVRGLRALGGEAFLYLAGGGEGAGLSRLCEGFQPTWVFSGPPGPPGPPAAHWAFIVLDRYATPEAEFRCWTALAPLIGIDEGGPCRRRFDFLIDLLPGLNRGANIRDPSLIPLPKNRRPFRGPGGAGGAPLRTLVSFGAEDPAGLGPLVCAALAAQNAAGELEIDFIPGALHRNRVEEPGAAVRALPPAPGLGERLAEYDLLITHFGLTAFEALSAGVPALLVSPGPYHEKLTKRAGFFSAGIGRRGARRAAALLFRPRGGRKTLNRAFISGLEPEKTAARHGLDRPQKQDLAGLVGSFSPEVSPACPACGGPNRPAPAAGKDAAAASAGPPPVLARFSRRTYRRCPRCGVVYMDRLDPPPVEYGRDYFFELYKKQYGKTYLEDFPGLVAAGRERLNRIQALPPRKSARGGRLLDIGCAYGPFLAAARDAGFSPLGVDPAEDAAAYVRETLKLEARQGYFPAASPGEEGGFDVITLWYVIEHFQDPRRVLAEIRRLLKPGGTLAFSTPSLSGVSGRKNRRAFLEKSPEDHWTVWSPRSCGRILKMAGFRLRRVHITGHHPERFPLIGRFARPGGIVYAILLRLSRIFRLGDTFEAYARKDTP